MHGGMHPAFSLPLVSKSILVHMTMANRMHRWANGWQGPMGVLYDGQISSGAGTRLMNVEHCMNARHPAFYIPVVAHVGIAPCDVRMANRCIGGRMGGFFMMGKFFPGVPD